MIHGDDDGIILPPRIASAHVVLLPIIRKSDDRENVMTYTESLAEQLRETYYHHRKLVVEIDHRDIGGARGWDWIKKGIPVRVEIGPRDIARDSVYVGRRDKAHNEKVSLKRDQFVGEITNILDEIQNSLFTRAQKFSKEHTQTFDDGKAFYDFFTSKNSQNPEIHGGFAVSPWCGKEACELKLKDELGVTIRCLPFEHENSKGSCICCDQPGKFRAVFAKAY